MSGCGQHGRVFIAKALQQQLRAHISSLFQLPVCRTIEQTVLFPARHSGSACQLTLRTDFLCAQPSNEVGFATRCILCLQNVSFSCSKMRRIVACVLVDKGTASCLVDTTQDDFEMYLRKYGTVRYLSSNPAMFAMRNVSETPQAQQTCKRPDELQKPRRFCTLMTCR